MNYTKSLLIFGLCISLFSLIEGIFSDYPFRSGGPFWRSLASILTLTIVGLVLDFGYRLIKRLGF